MSACRGRPDEGEPNSLYYLSGERRWRCAALVGSEPLDDGPGWQQVKPSTLVYVDVQGLRTEPLTPGRKQRRVTTS